LFQIYSLYQIKIRYIKSHKKYKYTPPHRLSKIEIFTILEPHSSFDYNRKNGEHEGGELSNDQPGDEKSLKIIGLHKL